MSIEEVSLLSAGERRTVLHTFNKSTLEPPSGPYLSQTIHGMLEYWAAHTPRAPAVEFEVRIRASLRFLPFPPSQADRVTCKRTSVDISAGRLVKPNRSCRARC